MLIFIILITIKGVLALAIIGTVKKNCSEECGSFALSLNYAGKLRPHAEGGAQSASN